MIRRAYQSAFSDDEIDDIYSGAWVGTLRALGRRHQQMSDEEIRKYLLAAVANQASKELRRRRRKPTAPLELVDAVPDDASTPDDQAVGAERTRITRDLLASLPPRRRAVMYLRYGWGLEPSQVRELIGGLSPRSYRKEITRGVDELAERMRRFERGEWCADRESLLKAYAAGLADAEERRQARAHLSHCNQCSDFVARLGGHLHDLGAAASLPVAFDALDGDVSLPQRIGELGDRARDAVGGLIARGGEAGPEAAGGVIAAGGARGAGATAGAGLLAKLGGIGTAGKIAAVCLSGGAAATVCVSAGVLPGAVLDAGPDRVRSAPRDPGEDRPDGRAPGPIDAQVSATRPPNQESTAGPPAHEAPAPDPGPAPAPEPEPLDPVAADAPPVQQEFGVAAAASSGGSGTTSEGGSGSGGSGGGGGSAVQREFGP